MKKIIMLAFANIRKSKGHSISLLIMLIITSAVLNIGLLMFNNYNSYFSKINKELNTSDCYITLPYQFYNEDVLNFIKNHENVNAFEKEISVSKKVKVEKKKTNDTKETMLFFNNEVKRNFSKKKFIGEYLPLDDNSIYLGYYFNIEWGYKLNDTIKLEFGEYKKEYTIKGFVEDIYFATPDMGMISGYFTEKEFKHIVKKSESKNIVFFADLNKNNTEVETELNDYIINKVGQEIGSNMDFNNSILGIHLSTCQMSRTMMANILSVMFVTFSFIIAVVCLFIIRFRIDNSIEEDMVKIGSLKAIGYISSQIIGSIVVQFSLIATVGSMIGIACSYPALPIISDVLAHQSALKWEQGFDVFNSSIAFLAIFSFVLLISFLTSYRIKKINPIIALRGGIKSHSFRKNYFALDKSSGILVWCLGLKAIFHNKKQSIMISIITLVVTFAGVFGLLMFYNSTIDTTTFAETPGLEVSNIEVEIDSKVTDNKAFLKEIKKRDGIEFAQFIDNTVISTEGLTLLNTIMEDFNTKRTKMVYEGRYPTHDNEIVINGNVAELIGKKIGDTITVKGQNEDLDYLITGLQQGANQAGNNSAMTYKGYTRLYPDFKFNTITIYLEDGIETESYLKKLVKDYKSVIKKNWNIDKEFEDGLGMYIPIVSKSGAAILFISILVVILVLYFVINSFIVKSRRELGIQKAIGFTTIQLMNQVSFSILPPITIGVISGSIIGAYSINPVMSIAQKGMGVLKANYIIKPEWICMLAIAVVVLSYFVSMLLTLRIRKISAYALVIE